LNVAAAATRASVSGKAAAAFNRAAASAAQPLQQPTDQRVNVAAAVQRDRTGTCSLAVSLRPGGARRPTEQSTNCYLSGASRRALFLLTVVSHIQL